MLLEKTGQPTIPQIFVGGRHIGGATETIDAYNNGDLKTMLEAQAIPMKKATANGYAYLPKWLHPR